MAQVNDQDFIADTIHADVSVMGERMGHAEPFWESGAGIG